MTQVQLAVRIHHKSQDVSALEGHQDPADSPELLPIDQGLGVIGEVAGAQGAGVAGRHPIGQSPRACGVGLVNLDENGLVDPKGSAGENQSPLVPGVFQAGHGLVIEDFDVGSPEVVEAEVALELGREEVGVLGVEGVLWDGARGGHHVQALLLQVEVAQADREAGVLRLLPQRGPADGGEGAGPQAVGRNDFAVCGEGQEKTKEVSLQRERKGPGSLQIGLIQMFKRENQRPAAINTFSPLKYGSGVP